jgi:hypothetical protein
MELACRSERKVQYAGKRPQLAPQAAERKPAQERRTDVKK